MLLSAQSNTRPTKHLNCFTCDALFFQCKDDCDSFTCQMMQLTPVDECELHLRVLLIASAILNNTIHIQTAGISGARFSTWYVHVF